MVFKRCGRLFLSLSILLLVLYLPKPSEAQTTFNAFTDFSTTSNPTTDGNWKYGYSQTLGGSFNLYTTHEQTTNGVDAWRQVSSTLPAIAKNVTNATILYDSTVFPYHDYLFSHPGQNGEYSVIRWTAPSAGMFNINARFSSLAAFPTAEPTTDVHVLLNSAPIFNDNINSYFATPVKRFTTTLNLEPGDTIDFVVGYGLNQNYSSDRTGVSVIISTDTTSPTPTPTPNLTMEEFWVGDTPTGIVEGPDKNIWFAKFNDNKISRITPQGVITDFSVPSPGSNPYRIISGSDGSLWFTEWMGNKIVRLTLDGSFQEYRVPTAGGYLEDLIMDQDRNIWFSEAKANKIGRLTTTGTFTEYPIPTQNTWPHGMALGIDGNVWFTEPAASKIGKITPQGAITEYVIPTLPIDAFGIVQGQDGALWFTTLRSPTIGRITTNGIFSEFFVPSGSGTTFLTVGWDGALWFTETFTNKIGRITTSGVITEYDIPTSNAAPHSITTDSNGGIWFTDANGRVGHIKFNDPLVFAGGPYSVNEGSSVEVTAKGNDPGNNPLTFSWDLDNNGSFETSGQTVTFSAVNLDGTDSRTIVVRMDNGTSTVTNQTTVNIKNVVPTVGIISGPTDPVAVNTLVNMSASFTDPAAADTHTAVWDWGDSSTSNGDVNQENNTVTGNHTYSAAGVYTVKLTVNDDDNGSGESLYQYVVIYNPGGGFMTGSGRYDAPAGSIVAEPNRSGMTIFGTTAKYVNNVLTGNSRLNFRSGPYSFVFDSTSYDWLVVTNGNQGQLKGKGTVNGSGDYTFQVTALDASTDTIRFQIWDSSNNVVYDNDISPLTVGNIEVHN